MMSTIAMRSHLIKALYVLLLVCGLGVVSVSSAQQSQRRLLVIGDSLSDGLYASSERNAFRYLVAEELNMDLGYLKACHVSDALESWRAWGWQPDVILVELGIHGLELHDENWGAEYGNFLDVLAMSGSTIIVGTIPWSGWGCDGLYPKYQLALGRNDAIRLEAGRRGLAIADLWAVTVCCFECLSQPGDASPFSPGFQGDDFHPNDFGHQVIAQVYIDVIEYRECYLPLIVKEE